MILFLILLTFPSRRRTLQFDTGVNINGQVFNLSSFGEEIGKNSFNDGDDIYTFTLFDELSAVDFAHDDEYIHGVVALRIHNNTTEPLGLLNTQTFKQLDNDLNKGVGIIYYISANSKDESVYQSVFNVYCDINQNEPLLKSFEYVSLEYSKTAIFNYKSKYGCPTKAAIPTSKLPQASCRYDSPVDAEEMSISLNLRNYNMLSGHILTTSDNYTVLHQPCGIIQCPPKYVCDVIESSMWLCNTSHCDSYGFISSNPSFAANEKGLIVHYSYNQVQSDVFYQCDESVNVNMPIYTNASYSNGKLLVNALSSDICPKKNNRPDNDVYNFQLLSHHFELNFSNQIYNSSDEVVWNHSYDPSLDIRVFFNPLSHINCPDGYICDSDHISQAWICYKSGGKFCDSIIYADEKPSFDHYSIDIDHAVNIEYKGSNNARFVEIFECNKKLNIGEMRVKDGSFGYDIDKNEYFITISSKDMCNLKWDFRNFPPSPELTPRPRYSSIVYKTNGTHSIKFDSSRISLFEPTAVLLNRIGSGKRVQIFLSPFVPISCPVLGYCDDLNRSDGYLCYDESDNESFRCMSISNFGSSIKSELINEGKLGYGVRLETKGIGQIRTFLRIRCGEDTIRPSVLFVEPDIFAFTIHHKDACVKNEVDPVIPPIPQPTPNPPDTIPSVTVSNKGKPVKYGPYSVAYGAVRILADGIYQDVNILMLPGNISRCPIQSNCFGASASTIWKCWHSDIDPNFCLPVGDIRWGVNISENNVTYNGGYGGYSTTLSAICGPTHISNIFDIEPNGTEENMHIYIRVLHPSFCDEPVPEEKNDYSWLFVLILLIVALALVLYIVIGSIYVKISLGYCDIPNRGLWNRIFNCIINFICCRCSSFGIMKSDTADQEYLNLDST